jgi:UDP-3-O-[3-hydroxymyristoyl] glucosamine N-acyltransferase
MFSVTQIAEFLDASVDGDASLNIVKLAPLDSAGSGNITFCAHAKFLEQLKSSQASAVLVTKEQSQFVKNTGIIVDNPYLAFAKISEWFDWRSPLVKGRAKNTSIASSAQVSSSAQICSGVVIGENSRIAEHCYIGANTVIADNCSIASDTRIEANVSIYDNVHIGQRCIVHSGAVIGADGFGFAKGNQGWQKIYQLGGVQIGSDVEIGAGTTVDRGAIADTIIGDGVKLDNQVQIAHNVHLGDHTAIAGCSAIAGSTRIGENCTIAGLSGVTGHLEIAANTHVTAMSLVSHSIKEAGVYSSGTGIEKHHSWKRNVVRFRALDTLVKRVKSLENEMQKLSSKE